MIVYDKYKEGGACGIFGVAPFASNDETSSITGLNKQIKWAVVDKLFFKFIYHPTTRHEIF
jgi:hypothetical protein